MDDKKPKNGRESLRILIFSASLRTESLNSRLVRLAIKIIEKNGATD